VAIVRSTPANGETEVAVTRETIIEFALPIKATGVTAANFYAQFGEETLAANVRHSPDRKRVTLFYEQPLPASVRVRVTVNGDNLLDDLNRKIDADGDSVAGGIGKIDFYTLGLSRIAGTNVFGYVYDSYNKNPDGTDRPAIGATIRVDGFPEANAVTHENGYFILRDMPAPVVFVHIDGSTATNAPPGTVYATVGKPFHSVAGRSTQLMMDGQSFNIYLPPMSVGDIKPLSSTANTDVSFGTAGKAKLVEMFPNMNPAVWDQTKVTFPPNSAIDETGKPATQAAIIPVPADRLPAPLSPGLNHQLDIAIVATGATNFDTPAPACFPNLPDPVTGQPLPPGAKSALVSFNHDTGQWEVVGSMTVSADGRMVCTDPGVGIRAPGWHGSQAGTPPSEVPPPPQFCVDADCGIAIGMGLFSCALGFIPGGSCVSEFVDAGLETAAECILHAEFGNPQTECYEAAGANAAGAVAGCLIGSVPILGGAFNCIFEGIQILGDCSCFGQSTVALTQSNGPFRKLEAHAEIIRALRDFYTILYGSSVWVNVGQHAKDPAAAQAQAILNQVTVTTSLSSDGGNMITSAEAGNFRSLPRPTQIAEADVNSLIAYTNRTTELWSQGIFTHTAAGRTDFIDREKLLAALNGARTAISQLRALGTQEINIFSAFSGALTAIFANLRDLRRQPVPVARLSYALTNQASGLIQRGQLNSDGRLGVAAITPNTLYRLDLFNPVSLSYGFVPFISAGAGSVTRIPQAVLYEVMTERDTDNDGLPDITESVIGTSKTNPDTDGDGVKDGAEVQQGTNPLDGLPAATGIIATAKTPGTAVDIAAFNDIAVVAELERGVSVLSVVNGTSPVIIAQVNTLGNAQAVAFAGNLVAVANGAAGLAIIDITDPRIARIIHQVNLGGVAQAVTTGGPVAYVGLSSGQVVAVDMISGTELARVPVGNAVQDVALGGEYLYVFTSGMLHAVSLDDFSVASSVASPGAAFGPRRFRLFVGGGIAYVTHSRGYNTFNLADPAKPVLITAGNTQQAGWKQIVANGSGLGVAAVGVNPTESEPQDIYLYDVSNPAQTNNFLTAFPTPGLANTVSIYNGLAYVADGQSGIQVINYREYDRFGKPPTITLSTNFAAGVAEEGKTVRVSANVSDDVQVRNVEFYVDTVKVATDGNFPFEHRFTTPLRSKQPSFTLRAKATDTGGNVAWTNLMTVTLIADATPPRVARVSPRGGSASVVGSVFGVSATFSEPIDSTKVTAGTLRLFSAGPDGISGTADDVPVTGGVVSYRNEIKTALLTFTTPLPSSLYRAVVSPTINDLVGNPMAAEFTWTFRVKDPIFWARDTSGFWDVPGNWSTGAVPGSDDIVIIDRPAGNFTITHRSGSTSIVGLRSTEALVLSGGELSISATAQISNGFTLSGGTLSGSANVTLSGPSAWTSGTISGLGAVNIGLSGTLVISGTVSLIGRTLNNAGVVNWTGGGTFYMYDETVFNNLASGLFDIQGDATLSYYSGVIPTFNNAGIVRKSAGCRRSHSFPIFCSNYLHSFST